MQVLQTCHPVHLSSLGLKKNTSCDIIYTHPLTLEVKNLESFFPHQNTDTLRSTHTHTHTVHAVQSTVLCSCRYNVAYSCVILKGNLFASSKLRRKSILSESLIRHTVPQWDLQGADSRHFHLNTLWVNTTGLFSIFRKGQIRHSCMLSSFLSFSSVWVKHNWPKHVSSQRADAAVGCFFFCCFFWGQKVFYLSKAAYWVIVGTALSCSQKDYLIN